MNIEKLIHDLRARINPQYYDQIGTESYERHQVVKALEYLATENERLKELMAKRTREHQQEMTSFRLRVRSQDDATFAALREENERLRKDAEIGAAINRAAEELPDRYIVGISVEKDAATVDLACPSGHIKTMGVDGDNRLAAEINAAIDAARGAK